MAKLKGKLVGVPKGEVYPVTYSAGDECPPELEEAALDQGVLEVEEAPKKARVKEPVAADPAAAIPPAPGAETGGL